MAREDGSAGTTREGAETGPGGFCRAMADGDDGVVVEEIAIHSPHCPGVEGQKVAVVAAGQGEFLEDEGEDGMAVDFGAYSVRFVE